MKRASLLLKLYPRTWRDRYEVEFAALLEQHDSSFSTFLDLMLGAIDARLHDRRGLSLMERLDRLRYSSSTVFVALGVFVFVWGMLILDQVDVAWDDLARTNPAVRVATLATLISAGLAFLVMLATMLLMLAMVARRPTSSEQKALHLGLLGIPAVGLLIFLIAGTLGKAITLPGVIILFAFASLALAPAAIAIVVVTGDFNERDLRVVLVPAAVITAAMVAALLGMAISQMEASVQSPGGNWSAQLVGGLLLMIVPAGFAVRAVLRGLRALATAS